MQVWNLRSVLNWTRLEGVYTRVVGSLGVIPLLTCWISPCSYVVLYLEYWTQFCRLFFNETTGQVIMERERVTLVIWLRIFDLGPSSMGNTGTRLSWVRNCRFLSKGRKPLQGRPDQRSSSYTTLISSFRDTKLIHWTLLLFLLPVRTMVFDLLRALKGNWCV